MRKGDLENKKKRCILFFVKYPKKGEVKSRLSADLNKTFIVNLYKMFVSDLLNTMKQTDFSIVICYYPNDSLGEFKNWLGSEYIYIPQQGENLGQRMKNCFINAFEIGFEQVCVIGSDSPDLPYGLFETAFFSLEKNDAVIGPTFDGGYYLLGFTKKSFSPNVFEGISWSTKAVFNETMHHLNEEGIKTKVLQQWRDVDTLKDLMFLYENKDFNDSETMTFLMQNFQKEK
jgi:rSAM/selenodomain-associated transferase 1